MTEINFVDFFAGIGAFRKGFENVNSQRKRKTFQYAGSCELDVFAGQIYKKNFGEYPSTKDATRLDYSRDFSSAGKDIDLLCAGFPCPAFSSAGKRRGFDDPRGRLFFEIIRFAKAKRPKMLFLENVKGLLTAQDAFAYGTMLDALAEIGYDAQWQVIDGQYWLPQKRERMFIVATPRERPFPRIFPLGEDAAISFERLSGGKGKQDQEGQTRKDESNYPVTNCFDAHYYKGIDAHGARTMVAIPVLTVDKLMKFQNGRRFKENGEPTFTLTTTDSHGIFDGHKFRRFTPLELERLMGLPDNWTATGIAQKGDVVWNGEYKDIPQPDGSVRRRPVMVRAEHDGGEYPITIHRRYEKIGNSVMVPCVEFLSKYIIETFESW